MLVPAHTPCPLPGSTGLEAPPPPRGRRGRERPVRKAGVNFDHQGSPREAPGASKRGAYRNSVIWNDHFILGDRSWEVKLAFSHGLAQSAKLTVFEARPLSPRNPPPPPVLLPSLTSWARLLGTFSLPPGGEAWFLQVTSKSSPQVGGSSFGYLGPRKS